MVTENPKETDLVTQGLKLMARSNYSNPPIHGARIVNIVLSNPELTKLWKEELQTMSGRIR